MHRKVCSTAASSAMPGACFPSCHLQQLLQQRRMMLHAAVPQPCSHMVMRRRAPQGAPSPAICAQRAQISGGRQHAFSRTPKRCVQALAVARQPQPKRRLTPSDENGDEEEGADAVTPSTSIPATSSPASDPTYAPASAAAAAAAARPRLPVPLAPGCVRGTFAVWHDEKRFKGTGDTSLAQRALLALGGVRVGGHPKAAPTNGPMGWQQLSDWDVLWSPSATARKAAQAGLAPGQLASGVPGSDKLTKKKGLARTLSSALGQDAFTLVTPLTFELPSQMAAWLAHLKQLQHAAVEDTAGAARDKAAPAHGGQEASSSGSRSGCSDAEAAAWLPTQLAQRLVSGRAASRSGSSGHAEAAAAAALSEPGGLWILKTSQHLGKGMEIQCVRDAVKAVVVRHQQAIAATTLEERKAVRPFTVAQRYVSRPSLLGGRKFGLRMWAVITSVDPLRVYLHSNGLVLFSSNAYDISEACDMRAHLTNYAQNMHGNVWSLAQLEEHLGAEAWANVHAQLSAITALTFAAGARDMRAACADARVPHGAVFELFGLDFLLDEQLRPWLLEVNSTPSLAVEHADVNVQRMIYDQKAGMVCDMLRLLRVPARFMAPRTGAQPVQSQAMSAAAVSGGGSVVAGRTVAGVTAAAAAAASNPLAVYALDSKNPDGSAARAGSGEAAAAAQCEKARVAEACAVAAREVEELAALREAIQAAVAHAFYDEKVCELLLETEAEAQAARTTFLPLAPLMPSKGHAAALGWSVDVTPRDEAVRAWYMQRGELVAQGALPLVTSAHTPESVQLFVLE